MSTSTIIISTANRDRLAAVLDAAQGEARTRRYSVEDVFTLAEQSERRLDQAGIPQRLRTGVEVYDDHPWSVARSYGSTAYGTSVRIVRRAAGWALAEAIRTYANERPVNRLTIPAESKAEVIDAMLRAQRVTFAAPVTEAVSA